MPKKIIIVLLIIITAVSINYFYALYLPGFFKNLRFLILILTIPIGIYFFNYQKGTFNLSIAILTISIVFSIFMSFLAWDQPVFLGVLITVPYLIWPIYFILFRLNVPIDLLEKIIILFGLIYIVLFAYQFLNPSNVLFGIGVGVKDGELTESRGIVRVLFPGVEIFWLATFIAITKLTNNGKLKSFWIIFAILGVIIPFMQVTRSILIPTLLIYIYHFNRFISFRIKIIALALIVIVAFLTLDYYRPLIDGMLEAQKENISEGDDYVRVKAAKYFLQDFSPTLLNQIFGNGMGHEQGSYGQFIKKIKENQGFYQSDVGIIGAYSSFGIFYILGWIILFFKVFSTKTSKNYIYVKYFLFCLIPGAFIGQTLTNPTSAITVVYALYIFEKNIQIKHKLKRIRNLINNSNRLENYNSTSEN